MTLQNGDWSLPDLPEYGPDVPAFTECTSIGIGGFPVALTPAREIVLPTITLPFASPTSTPGDPSETRTTRLPVISDAVTLPSSTPSRRRSGASPSSEGEPGQDSGRPATTIVVPSRPSTSSGPDAVTDGLPDDSQPFKPPSGEFVQPSFSSDRHIGVTSPGIVIVPVSPAATPNSPNNAPPGVAASIDRPPDQFVSYIAAGIPGESFDVDESDRNAYILPDGSKLAAGEQPIIVSGTTFSALPSESGVVAVADGMSMTLTDVLHAGPTSRVRISDTAEDVARYVLPDGSTATEGGQAITVSGSTYSALPSNSGIIVAANGQSKTLDAASLPTPPPTLSSPDIYILNASLTMTAGGPAATISGTTYSALPSNSGILVIAHGETTTILARSSIPSSDSGKAINSYILDGTATISVGGPVVTISGIGYSALASGSGVVAVEDGKSSTIGPNGGLVSIATSSVGEGRQDDTAPFLGGAAGLRVWWDGVVYRAAVAAVLFVWFLL